MAGAVEQPTNATDPRQPVQGEVAATEEQKAAAPIAPSPAPGPSTTPVARPQATNYGTVSAVMPTGQTPPVPQSYRPTTREAQIGQAILGMGQIGPVTRRLAMALTGSLQAGVIPEVLPEYITNTASPVVSPGTEVPMETEANTGTTGEQMVTQAEQTTQEPASAEEATT